MNKCLVMTCNINYQELDSLYLLTHQYRGIEFSKQERKKSQKVVICSTLSSRLISFTVTSFVSFATEYKYTGGVAN